ncbi:hypothetical protein [Nocardioides sp. GY 10127]|uniref:hypothetical protein n=1 Tax=Nocardioides sp. GY 10127 TaxID=2569762 RepID=UPI0010A86F6B|nr:hypothetical protein [Nocardioides sp. GY 10127]TIC84241.1 hypothetical protein E8D37_05495 [Nocardioides sp. GY 10127]
MPRTAPDVPPTRRGTAALLALLLAVLLAAWAPGLLAGTAGAASTPAAAAAGGAAAPLRITSVEPDCDCVGFEYHQLRGAVTVSVTGLRPGRRYWARTIGVRGAAAKVDRASGEATLSVWNNFSPTAPSRSWSRRSTSGPGASCGGLPPWTSRTPGPCGTRRP